MIGMGTRRFVAAGTNIRYLPTTALVVDGIYGGRETRSIWERPWSTRVKRRAEAYGRSCWWCRCYG